MTRTMNICVWGMHMRLVSDLLTPLQTLDAACRFHDMTETTLSDMQSVLKQMYTRINIGMYDTSAAHAFVGLYDTKQQEGADSIDAFFVSVFREQVHIQWQNEFTWLESVIRFIRALTFFTGPHIVAPQSSTSDAEQWAELCGRSTQPQTFLACAVELVRLAPLMREATPTLAGGLDASSPVVISCVELGMEMPVHELFAHIASWASHPFVGHCEKHVLHSTASLISGFAGRLEGGAIRAICVDVAAVDVTAVGETITKLVVPSAMPSTLLSTKAWVATVGSGSWDVFMSAGKLANVWTNMSSALQAMGIDDMAINPLLAPGSTATRASRYREDIIFLG